jgi:hypothetical protein
MSTKYDQAFKFLAEQDPESEGASAADVFWKEEAQ